MNISGQLSVQDFTTVDRVKALVAPSIAVGDLDVLIQTLITDVSAQFVRFLGLHATKIERTELYEVRKYAKLLSLDAKPIDATATFALKYGSDTQASSLVSRTSDEFVVNKPVGCVRLLFSTPYQPGYIEVTYTGGIGTSTANLISGWPDLAGAADRQVLYLLQRRGALGGNTQLASGGGTSFATGQYGMLHDVEHILASHRRAV